MREGLDGGVYPEGTIIAGTAKGDRVKAVYVDHQPVERVLAFNIEQGWADVYKGVKHDSYVIQRLWGKINVEWDFNGLD